MAAGLGLALLAGGCGSVASRPAAPGPAVPPPLSLRTSADAAGATWATVPMGAASGADEFWELFALPGGGQWSLRTPPDIATNGAIVLAAPDAAGQTGGGTLVAGVRPSLDLAFSPITSTSDLGRSWTVSPPQSGLADVPDALAAAPHAYALAGLPGMFDGRARQQSHGLGVKDGGFGQYRHAVEGAVSEGAPADAVHPGVHSFIEFADQLRLHMCQLGDLV